MFLPGEDEIEVCKETLIERSHKWIDSEEFKKHTTSDASNNDGRLAARVEYVRDKLLGRI